MGFANNRNTTYYLDDKEYTEVNFRINKFRDCGEFLKDINLTNYKDINLFISDNLVTKDCKYILFKRNNSDK